MSIKEHGFFKMIEQANWLFKKVGAFGSGRCQRVKLLSALKVAHPFVFDKSLTHEKRFLGRGLTREDRNEDRRDIRFEDVYDLVSEFSLPFKTSLYLMTDSPTIHAPVSEERQQEYGMFKLEGYLLDEVSPEKFLAWEVCSVEDIKTGHTIPHINEFNIDLRMLERIILMAKAADPEVFDHKIQAHVLKETTSILNFTDCISVKRIGIEVPRAFTMKTKNFGIGVTKFKYDNIIHIADKVEYEYVKPLEDSPINWEHVGFWRGHWRAFYVKNSIGDNKKDENGWNIVDYGRIGKDRVGNYNVPGYTWVIEHTRGNPELAEIKTRMVKHGDHRE